MCDFLSRNIYYFLFHSLTFGSTKNTKEDCKTAENMSASHHLSPMPSLKYHTVQPSTAVTATECERCGTE